MKPILVFRHVEREGAGSLGDYLDRQRVPWQLVRLDRGEPVPDDPRQSGGLVFMGGPMSVNDPLPFIAAECNLIRRAVGAGVPVLGHCLGGQLISKALGGQVLANPVKEIGWHTVTKLRGPAADYWLADVPDKFLAYHWHGETFSLPPGASLLMSSEHCLHQAFCVGERVLAMQCHVEMTATLVRAWAAEGADELLPPSDTVQTAQEMTRDLAARVGELERIAHSIYDVWLRNVGS